MPSPRWTSLALPLLLAVAAAAAPLPDAPALEPRLAQQLDAIAGAREPRPPYANRMLLEASPYLQRHGTNPVDWRPYGEASFTAARESGRPLFVSIGYATCHWCQVMEEESYQDVEVARALNRGFVAVKIDREAMPETAEAYARMAGAMGERIGWPLHVFLLPDGTPILGATYLPREDRPGRAGILTVLDSVATAAADNAPRLRERAEALRESVAAALVAATPTDPRRPDAATLAGVAQALLDASDPEWGGARALPKRPTDPSVPLLLRVARRGGDPEAQELAVRGLLRMADAPIRGADGGFYEAATDRRWTRTRDERRLADNAALAQAYLEAWQATGRDRFREVAMATLDFLLTELANPDGSFAAALRDDDGPRLRDDQALADANGLALSAFARAGFAFSEPRYTDAARRLGAFLVTQPPARAPRLADLAFVTGGLLDLLEVDPDVRWLDAALAFQRAQDTRFADPVGGYFLTATTPGPGLPHPKHARDGAMPSANGAAAWNLLRLHALTGEAAHLDRMDALLAVFGDAMRAEPRRHAGLALALDARLDGLHEIALLVPAEGDAEPFLAPLRQRFVPNRVLLQAQVGPGLAPLVDRASLLASKRPLRGRTTAFVCRDQVCALPAREPAQLVEQTARFTPLGDTPPTASRAAPSR